jgi:hypothetical protein
LRACKKIIPFPDSNNASLCRVLLAVVGLLQKQVVRLSDFSEVFSHAPKKRWIGVILA